MEYRYLGKSGLLVSALSLGGWVLADEVMTRIEAILQNKPQPPTDERA